AGGRRGVGPERQFRERSHGRAAGRLPCAAAGRGVVGWSMDRIRLTDGGLETVLIHDHGGPPAPLAAFATRDSPEGRGHPARYYRPYLRLAEAHGTGFVLETPTWRANRDWGAAVGYDEAQLARVNQEAVAFVAGLVEAAEDVEVSGCVG